MVPASQRNGFHVDSMFVFPQHHEVIYDEYPEPMLLEKWRSRNGYGSVPDRSLSAIALALDAKTPSSKRSNPLSA